MIYLSCGTFYIKLKEMRQYERDSNAPSVSSEPGGKWWQHHIRGWRNCLPKLIFLFSLSGWENAIKDMAKLYLINHDTWVCLVVLYHATWIFIHLVLSLFLHGMLLDYIFMPCCRGMFLCKFSFYFCGVLLGFTDFFFYPPWDFRIGIIRNIWWGLLMAGVLLLYI